MITHIRDPRPEQPNGRTLNCDGGFSKTSLDFNSDGERRARIDRITIEGIALGAHVDRECAQFVGWKTREGSL